VNAGTRHIVPAVPATTNYRPRLADGHLIALIDGFPAVLINGPRAVGKTTTARQQAASEVRLDQPAQSAAFQADPDAALRGREEPVLLDEWQEVPEVLGAVKRSVDDDPRPGRFILTGSVRSDLEHKVWPGTGRLMRMQMYGLTELEIEDAIQPSRTPFLAALAACSPNAFSLPATRPDLRDYITMALRGGFPGVILNERTEFTDMWVDSYLDQLLTRDSNPLAADRDHHKLARYFQAVAANSAGLPDHKTLYDAAGVTNKTADVYDALLTSLFVAELVPAWSSGHLDRLIKTPKRYVVDSSLMASALGATVETVLASSDLLGRMVDTFVLAQLRPEVAVARQRVRLYHARTKGGREEIDVVVELPGGKLMGLEIKASASPSAADAKHLRWLRCAYPDRFVAGAVLHTGPDVVQLDANIFAVPICAFWG
jgi:uncharacterized protein